MYLEASFRVAIFSRRESQYIWKKQEQKFKKIFNSSHPNFRANPHPGIPRRAFPSTIIT